MKKTLSLLLALVMLVLTLCVFASCGGSSEPTVKLVDIKLTDEDYAFAVNKEDPELLATVNTVLTRIKGDGTLDAIVNKYFSNDEANYQKFEAGTVDRSKNQLVVATNTPFSPFEFKVGNKFCGIDIEVAKIIADEMNAELVIQDMDFTAVILSVQNGESDIGMAGLTVSETRKQLVNFSDTYYKASQMIIAKIGDETFDSCTTAAEVEAILNQMDNSTKIGFQNGTTAGLYIQGDIDWEFPGFNVTATGFSSAALAVQELISGQINYVIVDEGPAKMLVDSMNNR